LRIVYENIFSNAPKTLYFASDFLMAGIAEQNTNLVCRSENFELSTDPKLPA
jgi:hypothetical protein